MSKDGDEEDDQWNFSEDEQVSAVASVHSGTMRPKKTARWNDAAVADLHAGTMHARC
jgi:hypothetical protein